jgi:hypothetical protein
VLLPGCCLLLGDLAGRAERARPIIGMQRRREARVACGKGAIPSCGSCSMTARTGVPDEPAATVNVGCKAPGVTALLELQSAAAATTAPRRRSWYTYQSWGPTHHRALVEADNHRQQICCVARGKLFACDLSPVAYTHEGQEYLLGLNGRKGRGPVAEAGLLSVVRKELLQAVAPLPGVTAADMDVLCRCAHKRCRHLVKSRPPLLFSWSATAGPCRTIDALRRGRENFALVTGLPPGARPREPCLLVCDGCADLHRADQRAQQAVTPLAESLQPAS